MWVNPCQTCGQDQPESSVVSILFLHNLLHLFLPPSAYTRNPSPHLCLDLYLWDQGHVCNRGLPELATENQTSRFPCEKSMNLTPIDGFGMPSLWFQSCWISPSYFQQLSKYRENWVRIYLYFDHLRNSIVLSTLLCVVLFSNKDCHQCCYYIKLCK